MKISRFRKFSLIYDISNQFLFLSSEYLGKVRELLSLAGLKSLDSSSQSSKAKEAFRSGATPSATK